MENVYDTCNCCHKRDLEIQLSSLLVIWLIYERTNFGISMIHKKIEDPGTCDRKICIMKESTVIADSLVVKAFLELGRFEHLVTNSYEKVLFRSGI